MSVVIKSSAIFSDCGKYRYLLTRRWDPTKELLCFIGLNPSTADETNDDPTVRRMIGYAKDWGFGGLLVVNIFAYRSTDPKGLYFQIDPVGPDNDFWIKHAGGLTADKTIAAWGNHGDLNHRASQVINMFGHDLEVLGITKTGAPKHPLYLKRDLKPIRWIFSDGGHAEARSSGRLNQK